MITLLALLSSVLIIIYSTTRFKIHPFLAILLATFFFGICAGMPASELLETINTGFGSTIGSIGLIIIAGLIIGAFLEKSGGAIRLAQVVLNKIGNKRIHTGMAFMGYVVSIPVFCDSGFIILSPLNKVLSSKSGKSIAGTAIALSLGLMATHTMVPPTPGPIAAAGIIDANLSTVIIVGLITSITALLICIPFTKIMGQKINIHASPQEIKQIDGDKDGPSAIKAFLPIVIPIILILTKSIATYPSHPLGTDIIYQTSNFLGHPVIALIIGMLLSFTLPKKFDKNMLSTSGWVGEALKSGAIIILITGAGGAFGKVLQQSDLATILEQGISSLELGIFLPFLIAFAIKTAQGSSTVAIITTASIVAPLLSSMGMDGELEKALCVVAIGAGSVGISHANDSFFWVVTQLSGMSVSQGYRLHSLGTGILGISAILILSIINWIL